MSAEVSYTLVLEKTQHQADIVLASVMQHYEAGIDGPYLDEEVVLPNKFRAWSDFAYELGFKITGQPVIKSNYLGNPVYQFPLEVK